VVGNPIAYTAPDGKQRVAVYTGVGWLAGGFAGGPCPASRSADGKRSPLASAMESLKTGAAALPAATATSGMLHVFKLP